MVSRSASVGSAIPTRFISRKASWNGRQSGLHGVGVLVPHHPESLTGSGGHHPVGDRKGQPHLFVLQRFDATLDPPGLLAGLLQELCGRGLLLLAGRGRRRALLLDPVRVGLHERA